MRGRARVDDDRRRRLADDRRGRDARARRKRARRRSAASRASRQVRGRTPSACSTGSGVALGGQVARAHVRLGEHRRRPRPSRAGTRGTGPARDREDALVRLVERLLQCARRPPRPRARARDRDIQLPDLAAVAGRDQELLARRDAARCRPARRGTRPPRASTSASAALTASRSSARVSA